MWGDVMCSSGFVYAVFSFLFCVWGVVYITLNQLTQPRINHTSLVEIVCVEVMLVRFQKSLSFGTG